MTVNVSKPAINVRAKLAELDRPTGAAGAAILAAETSEDQFKLINAGRRNLIINGGMEVAQRGTSHTGNGYGSIDRMFFNQSGATGTMSQETFATGEGVGGCVNYCKIDVTTGNNYGGLIYQVEKVSSLPTGRATFSFYAKGTNPTSGSYDVNIQLIPDGNNTFKTPLDSQVTISDEWKRYSFTFEVPDYSGMTAETNSSKIYMRVVQHGSDTGTQPFELNITGLQLESGGLTPFEKRSYGEELALCQRYFQTYRASNQTLVYIEGDGTNYRFISITGWPKTQMRTTPSVALPSVPSNTAFSGFNTNYVTNWAVENVTADQLSIRVYTQTTGGTAGTIVHYDHLDSGDIKFSAEL